MRILLSLGLLLVVAGCTAVAPSAPGARQAPRGISRDLTCRNGYAVAYFSDGTAYCAPVDGSGASATMTTGGTDTTAATPASTSE